VNAIRRWQVQTRALVPSPCTFALHLCFDTFSFTFAFCPLPFDLMRLIVFACVANAGRSQMAAAFFNAARPRSARAISAGTQPGDRVHPEVVAVMREVGIELGSATPQRLTPELASGAAWLITMGCGEACPFVPGAQMEDWPLADPKGKSLDAVRTIRDEVRARVEAFGKREGLW
jgi:arsenate reductase (thioredoxin)